MVTYWLAASVVADTFVGDGLDSDVIGHEHLDHL